MPDLSDKEVSKYISKVNKTRKDYIKSDAYATNLCNAVLQDLNLKENDIYSGKFDDKINIEFMSIYQQLIDLYPNEFNGRDTPLLKESLQKSIYGSIEPELFNNYIRKLTSNNQDSFLLVPIGVWYFKNNQLAGHVLSLIIKKEENHLKIEVFDKAVQVPRERTNKPPIVHISEKRRLGVTNYIYEIPNTDKNIQSVVQAIIIGCKEESFQKQFAKTQGFKPLNMLSKCAEKEYYGNHIATTQYSQGNCYIKELTGALKYVLGEKENFGIRLGNGKLATKTKKFKSAGEINATIAELTINHLEKVGYGPEIKKYIRDNYKLYAYLKNDRSFITKVTEKKQQSAVLKRHFQTSSIPKFNKINKPNLNYNYGIVEKQSFFSRVKNLFKNKKVDIYHLAKNEISTVQKNCTDLIKDAKNEHEKSSQDFEKIKAQAINKTKDINLQPTRVPNQAISREMAER